MGVHYPLDVLGGAGVGIVGCLVALGIGWVIRPLMDLLLKIFRFLYIA
jgi:membrane-associated phospholipid phosphatase